MVLTVPETRMALRCPNWLHKAWNFWLIYRASQIYWKSRNTFLNRLFLLKSDIHMQIPFLCDIRGWDICKTKCSSEIDKLIFILTSQYQNGLEIPQLTAEWPGHTLRGSKGPKLPKLVSHRLSGKSRGHLGHLEANLALLRSLQIITNMIVSVS